MKHHLLALFVVVVATALVACGASTTSSTPPVDTTVPTITSITLPAGAMGQVYHATLTAMNGTPPYTWQGTPPAGLAINPISGTIDGTLLTAGRLDFTVQVNDKNGKSSQAMVTIPVAYEAVPTERHYLLDANGNKTHMWARLLVEPVPARGSIITIGSGNNCAGCFTHFSMEFGVDTLNNPATIALFEIGFSQDGQTINYHLDGGGVRNGNSGFTNPGAIRTFSDKPKFWVVLASFRGDGRDPSESGATNFLLDYK